MSNYKRVSTSYFRHPGAGRDPGATKLDTGLRRYDEQNSSVGLAKRSVPITIELMGTSLRSFAHPTTIQWPISGHFSGGR
jgi:hypothetical protein